MGERRCIVFGGSGTLGRVVCAALADAGARVGFTYCRGEAVATALAASHGAVPRHLDATVKGACERVARDLAAELGGVDAFVHCAALASTAPVPAFDVMQDVDEEGWDRVMAVNVRGAFFACKAIAGALSLRGGNVVFLGSIDGVKAIPSPVPYATSKAALSGMARAIAKELGDANVRVNVVAPGVLDAGISATLPAHLKKEYLKHSGFRRAGRLDEIAGLVAWLALENTYVTGQTILVDGGL